MIKVKSTLSKAWSWFADRTPLWIILLYGYIMSVGIVQQNENASRVKDKDQVCKINCAPFASELIDNDQSISCWCYSDENTLKKLK